MAGFTAGETFMIWRLQAILVKTIELNLPARLHSVILIQDLDAGHIRGEISIEGVFTASANYGNSKYDKVWHDDTKTEGQAYKSRSKA